jgi:Cullin family
VLEEYVDGVLQGLLAFEACTAHSSLDLLVRYRDAFENYNVGMQYGSKLFTYLDRHWIETHHSETGRTPTEGVYKVYEMALIVWKDAAFESLKVCLNGYPTALQRLSTIG